MHVGMANIAMRTQIQLLIQEVLLEEGGWGHDKKQVCISVGRVPLVVVDRIP